jgi:hypothetical protein
MARKYRSNQITFKIDGFTPTTLPSARLAQYLLDLNALIGSGTKVHFQSLRKGSAQIVQWAEAKALPVIRKRLVAAKVEKPKRAPELTEAYERINQHLVEDNSAGTLRIGSEKVLDFPGKQIELRQIIGPVTQEESLDGQLVRIGGIDATVPVHLREGDNLHYCTANVDVARQLGPYLFRQTIRVFGTAYWYRHPNGQWKMDHFRVNTFQPLTDVTLHEATQRLRSIPHDDWDDDAIKKFKLREGG